MVNFNLMEFHKIKGVEVDTFKICKSRKVQIG